MPLPDLLKRQLSQTQAGRNIVKIVESNKGKKSSSSKSSSSKSSSSSSGSSSNRSSSNASSSNKSIHDIVLEVLTPEPVKKAVENIRNQNTSTTGTSSGGTGFTAGPMARAGSTGGTTSSSSSGGSSSGGRGPTVSTSIGRNPLLDIIEEATTPAFVKEIAHQKAKEEIPGTSAPAETSQGAPGIIERLPNPIESSLLGSENQFQQALGQKIYNQRMEQKAIQDTGTKTQEYVDTETVSEEIPGGRPIEVTYETDEGEIKTVTDSSSNLNQRIERYDNLGYHITNITDTQSGETYWDTPTTEQIQSFQQQTFEDEYRQVQQLNKPENLSQETWNTLERKYRAGQISPEEFQQQVETETITQGKPDFYAFVPENQYRTVIKRFSEGQYTEEQATEMLNKLNKQGMKNAPQYKVNEWAEEHYRFGEDGEKTFEQIKREDPALQGLTYNPEAEEGEEISLEYDYEKGADILKDRLYNTPTFAIHEAVDLSSRLAGAPSLLYSAAGEGWRRLTGQGSGGDITEDYNRERYRHLKAWHEDESGKDPWAYEKAYFTSPLATDVIYPALTGGIFSAVAPVAGTAASRLGSWAASKSPRLAKWGAKAAGGASRLGKWGTSVAKTYPKLATGAKYAAIGSPVYYPVIPTAYGEATGSLRPGATASQIARSTTQFGSLLLGGAATREWGQRRATNWRLKEGYIRDPKTGKWIEDPYGFRKGGDPSNIKKLYRSFAKKYHTDVSSYPKSQFQQMSRAYEAYGQPRSQFMAKYGQSDIPLLPGQTTTGPRPSQPSKPSGLRLDGRVIRGNLPVESSSSILESGRYAGFQPMGTDVSAYHRIGTGVAPSVHRWGSLQPDLGVRPTTQTHVDVGTHRARTTRQTHIDDFGTSSRIPQTSEPSGLRLDGRIIRGGQPAGQISPVLESGRYAGFHPFQTDVEAYHKIITGVSQKPYGWGQLQPDFGVRTPRPNLVDVGPKGSVSTPTKTTHLSDYGVDYGMQDQTSHWGILEPDTGARFPRIRRPDAVRPTSRGQSILPQDELFAVQQQPYRIVESGISRTPTYAESLARARAGITSPSPSPTTQTQLLGINRITGGQYYVRRRYPSRFTKKKGTTKHEIIEDKRSVKKKTVRKAKDKEFGRKKPLTESEYRKKNLPKDTDTSSSVSYGESGGQLYVTKQKPVQVQIQKQNVRKLPKTKTKGLRKKKSAVRNMEERRKAIQKARQEQEARRLAQEQKRQKQDISKPWKRKLEESLEKRNKAIQNQKGGITWKRQRQDIPEYWKGIYDTPQHSQYWLDEVTKSQGGSLQPPGLQSPVFKRGGYGLAGQKGFIDASGIKYGSLGSENRNIGEGISKLSPEVTTMQHQANILSPYYDVTRKTDSIQDLLPDQTTETIEDVIQDQSQFPIQQPIQYQTPIPDQTVIPERETVQEPVPEQVYETKLDSPYPPQYPPGYRPGKIPIQQPKPEPPTRWKRDLDDTEEEDKTGLSFLEGTSPFIEYGYRKHATPDIWKAASATKKFYGKMSKKPSFRKPKYFKL